jgi:hypothetical protein
MMEDWNDGAKGILQFQSLTELQIITIQDTPNPTRMADVIQAWSLGCKGSLVKIDVWTGARDWKQQCDFQLLPSIGSKRSGHTFLIHQQNGIWNPCIFP